MKVNYIAVAGNVTPPHGGADRYRGVEHPIRGVLREFEHHKCTGFKMDQNLTCEVSYSDTRAKQW